MDELIARYTGDGNAFAVWVATTPVAEMVNQDLQLAHAGMNCGTLDVMCAGCDALRRLSEVAADGGYGDTADFFYGRYEWLCRELAFRVF